MRKLKYLQRCNTFHSHFKDLLRELIMLFDGKMFPISTKKRGGGEEERSTFFCLFFQFSIATLHPWFCNRDLSGR